MNKLCLALTLLIAVASAKTAIDITGIIDVTKLRCLVNMRCEKATLEILSQAGTINQAFMVAWVAAQDTGFSQVDAVAVVNDKSDANTLADQITHALPGRFSGVTWLRVMDSPQLWTQDVSKRIAYLDRVKQRGVTAGIFSDANSWQRVTGSQDAGSDTLKAAPVWYIGNNDDSFTDFTYAGFGTWKAANLKQSREVINICNTLTNLDYFEK